jgi:hypothetical protein
MLLDAVPLPVFPDPARQHPHPVDAQTAALAVLATVLSAAFFVGGKIVLARTGLPWQGLWACSLITSGVCGLIAWAILGLPTGGWQWALVAGICGAAAHVCANLALAWGEASLLVPVSGAKQIVLLVASPLMMGAALPGGVVVGSVLATISLAMCGITPRTTHRHAPHPGAAFLLMIAAACGMALSDLCGMRALDAAGPSGRWGAIALWNVGFALLPMLYLIARGIRGVAADRVWPWRGVAHAVAQGLLFSAFVIALAWAFVVAPDPDSAVASVNVIIAGRGLVGVVLVLALDRWLVLGLEPIPRWIHGVRLLSAVILVAAVAVAC